MIRYEIRGAMLDDEDQLLDVAHHLDTVNLPAVREEIRGILEEAHKSFLGQIKDPKRRSYVFILWDHEAQKIIGTSMIIAQLGRRDAPYIYVDVIDEERYSSTLDKHFKHTVLKIGYSYNGPTEIGGLILRPEYRRYPERLGLLISYVRFLYIKMHRELFRDEVLAELLPPLEPDGTSHLWDALGRHFTDLTYAEADLLSKKNKEFIKGLWPEGAMYASLLSPQAQSVIGKVGSQTRGVEKMLRRIGFRYAERVDPFDGGPHFTAPTDEITLVQESYRGNVTRLLDDTGPARPETRRKTALFAVEVAGPPHFRAVVGAWEEEGGEEGKEEGGEEHAKKDAKKDGGPDGVRIGRSAAEHLNLREGDAVWVLPLS